MSQQSVRGARTSALKSEIARLTSERGSMRRQAGRAKGKERARLNARIATRTARIERIQRERARRASAPRKSNAKKGRQTTTRKRGPGVRRMARVSPQSRRSRAGLGRQTVGTRGQTSIQRSAQAVIEKARQLGTLAPRRVPMSNVHRSVSGTLRGTVTTIGGKRVEVAAYTKAGLEFYARQARNPSGEKVPRAETAARTRAYNRAFGKKRRRGK